MNELDDCIEELERGCGRYVEMWQESPWLAGMLVLPLEEVRKDIYQTTLLGKTVQYTRHGGLATVQ
jgi:CRISPR-associated endonuclease/helicase Cas3